MIKKILLITIVLGLTGCKQQNEEKRPEKTVKDTVVDHVEKDKKIEEKEEEKPQQLLFECKENDNGVSIYDDTLNKTCVCNETTFEKVYEIFYNESPDYLQKNLLKKLPAEDLVWNFQDCEVTYSWIEKDTLKINMFFQGGENDYAFYKNSDNKMEYKEYLSLP